MRHFLLWIAFLELLCGHVLAQGPENLIRNGSFESVELRGEREEPSEWKVKAGQPGLGLPHAEALFEILDDPNQAHSGKRYVRLKGQGEHMAAIQSSQWDGPLSAGIYEYALWVRGVPGQRFSFGNWIWSKGTTFEVTSEQWHHIKMWFFHDGKEVRPSDFPLQIKLESTAEDPHASVWMEVDDVVVREVTAGLANAFGSHMVLQRGQPIIVRGWAKTAGQHVDVGFASQSRQVVADEKGRWAAEFPAMTAGGPYTIDIDDFTAADDVMLGDVWLCAGQSNMEFGLNLVNGIYEQAPEAIAEADRPSLRLWSAAHQVQTEPAFGYRLRQNNGIRGWQTRWRRCSPETVKQGVWGGFSAVGYYFGQEIQQQQDVTIGLMMVTRGGTPIESWMRPQSFERIPAGQTQLDPVSDLPADSPLLKLPDLPEGLPPQSEAYNSEAIHHVHHQFGTGTPDKAAFQLGSACYNGILAPVIPYPVKGVLWYQGENNGKDAYYRKKLELMMGGWRDAFGQADLPFVIVQLCNWRSPEPDMAFHQVREAQLEAVQADPHAVLAVTIDLADAEGDGYGPGEIHPKNKRDVGHRVALAARKLVYGEDVVASGPTLKVVAWERGQAVLSFDNIAEGLDSRGEPLMGFELAGEDQIFVAATATIEGEHVVVSSPVVTEPRSVRYAYRSYVEPMGNLYNSAGLPASPFRTDRW